MVDQNRCDQLQVLLDRLENEENSARNSVLLILGDGSSDDTGAKIFQAVDLYPNCVSGLRLSFNAGHQAALLAGLVYVVDKSDAAVSIEYRGGAGQVLGVDVVENLADLLLISAVALAWFPLGGQHFVFGGC